MSYTSNNTTGGANTGFNPQSHFAGSAYGSNGFGTDHDDVARRIDEWYRQAEQMDKEADELEEERERQFAIITAFSLTHGSYMATWKSPAGDRIKSRPNDPNGDVLQLKRNLSKQPKSQYEQEVQDRIIKQMVIKAAQGGQSGTPHYYLKTKSPLYEKKPKVPGVINWMPYKFPLFQEGRRRGDPSLVAKFNQYADILYHKGKISTQPVFHASRQEGQRALENEISGQVSDPSTKRSEAEKIRQHAAAMERAFFGTSRYDNEDQNTQNAQQAAMKLRNARPQSRQPSA